ncbi:serine/threonine-protein kinase pak-2-like isoform X1 [Glycine soja]|uniref:Serine/threonine-protein kinase mph1 isoform A n=2 Tax=Glycine soja TaxID=3848 RepID=A0A445L535_GLYSO|nr:serine/threonine-protein kinase pak-2-like isoform X1 [Glycine soja]RZC18307.1 Serine/threonine-protein kinase mph1 isoform A [Glycine soja]
MDGKPNPDSSSTDLLRDVQAALKRHRPLGTMQSNCIRPKRPLLPQRRASNISSSSDATNSQEEASSKDSLITVVPAQNLDAQKKVQFSARSNAALQDGKATELENLSSHMSSLGFAEMEWVEGSQIESSSSSSLGCIQLENVLQAGFDASLKCESGVSSVLPKRSLVTQDHLQQFRSFLSQPATQSSVVGPSCATTTSVHSTSAPMLNSATRYSHLRQDGGSSVAAEPLGEVNANPCPITEGVVKSVDVSIKETNRMSVDRGAEAEVRASGSCIDDAGLLSKGSNRSKEQQGGVLKESGNSKYTSCDDAKGKEAVDVVTVQTQAPLPTTITSSSDMKLGSSKEEKREKTASSKGASGTRKRTYDPDLFFKVNGKLYQRLGKIGSGGSSEVHKVISSDCRIYALKKIKLKGRDYATAYGFCQEIEYLNRLKGKDNIIQLIDYEVTDKALLEEVMKGSFSNKDGRVKDDGCIYMVLEYGEIDLAHMLSQKWKELDGNNKTIDENWLRFHWQQILLAVNTIHEERIVHSDLKPANFLLVKGSLKLIDFGIAKAIMSDTTNIQRDSQVGTLSYMSPEAFLCNETDANGNIIKCGRPSDIWSLGCILYQMVYGRTPFSDYKTFWAKFKVITDPNHKITYEPVSNPWLLDLMKRCLAWDRNQRWRIPQLLQHPFLVPPVPSNPSLPQDHTCKLLQLISETCTYDPEATQLCSQLQRLLSDPLEKTTCSLYSRDQQLKLLSQMSELCIQLHERLTNIENK